MLSLEKQNHWREIYRNTHPHWLPATEKYAAVVRAYLSEDDKVLDLGCGRGGLVEQLDLRAEQVVGLDSDWASLVAHRLDIARVQGMGDALPFAPNQFDLVFSSWVMEHLERPFLTFHAIHHCLKPGGVYIFITPNKKHPLAWLNQLFGQLGAAQAWLVEKLYKRTGHDTFPTYYRANSAPQLDALCQQSQLKLRSLFTVPDPTYLAFSPFFFKMSCWFEDALPDAQKIHLVGIIQK